MNARGEAQGQALGRGRDYQRMPSLHQAVMARRSADPTTVLDDFDTEHEDMRRAATPAMARWQDTVVPQPRLVRMALPVVSIPVGAIHFTPPQSASAVADAARKLEAQLLAHVREPLLKASQAMAKLTFTLSDMDVEAVAQAFDVPVDMLQGKPDEARLARRRHGHAAVCPRHGPTKGGLCRRCQR